MEFTKKPKEIFTNAEFASELRQLLNKHSQENISNTPDFVLMGFVLNSLNAYNSAVQTRADWYGRMDRPAQHNELAIATERASRAIELLREARVIIEDYLPAYTIWRAKAKTFLDSVDRINA